MHDYRATLGGTVLTSMLLALGSPALAQEEIAPEKLREKALAAEEAEKKDPDGWKVKASVGLSGSFNNNQNVVGVDDGSTYQFGAVLGGEARWKKEVHLLEMDLKIQHGQTKTPQLSRFIKSQDLLDFKSTYFFSIKDLPWFGPFGRVKASTQIFPGYTVKTAPGTYVKRDATGAEIERRAFSAQERIDLTSAFEPFTLRESVGAFANPLERKDITIKTKLGVGAQQVIGQDGFVVADDDATPEIELNQIETTNQIGAELEVALGGALAEGIMSWGLTANFFQPIVSQTESTLSGLELLNTEIEAKISVKLAKWLSADYVFNGRRVPLVVDEWQLTNSIVLVAGFDII
jgi:hypothetical protein